MGTIANKLQRVLDTKEDIRQALIEEGKDVSTDMPFRLYPEVIKNSKIEGLVGMYMTKGYTNEVMSDNPVWYDTSGNGNHIQLKNFAWAEKSGVGMYTYDFKAWVSYNPSGVVKTPSKFSVIEKEDGSADLVGQYSSFKAVLKINGLSENVENGKAVKFLIQGNRGGIFSIEADGVYNIDVDYSSFESSVIYLSVSKSEGYQTFDTPITIEQIPTYENALCFDGVDDYGICETFPVLAKEKGYTVMALRKWITFPHVRSAALVSKRIGDALGAFLIEKYNSDSNPEVAISYGSGSTIKIDNNIPVLYQTSNLYNGTAIGAGDKEDTNLLYIGASYTTNAVSFSAFANYALYALAIFDHDTTEEERQPVIDYWKKEFPELFPDQAWTVAGKTNSDADKATIKNITGNGNDLVLTNVGYAENSGYGKWPIQIATASTVFIDQPYGTAHFIADNSTYSTLVATNLNSVHFKFRVREMQEGAVFIVRSVRMDNYNIAFKDFSVKENGIYEFEYENTDEPFAIFFYNGALGSGVHWDFYVDILQDPNYEGYLVLDGVKDSVQSKNFNLGRDWTMVGEWFMPNASTSPSAGIIKASSLFLYNRYSAMTIYINESLKVNYVPVKSLRAVCSDGRCYDQDWNEYIIPAGNIQGSGNALVVGKSAEGDPVFTEVALKNLAFYETALSKEQCVAAYNYLQGLKN